MDVYNEVTNQYWKKDWKFNDNGIEKSFQNFSQALSFIVQVGFSEKQGHHRTFNVYNKSTFD
jgi:pterin-4a-carbinolamine dehydratase